ncbi:hypothetical protein B0T17DRAFT_614285 [Bombardia bombarda]|uniref:Rhodopsin domain-containing protein n=1 Tax=Bombardia bombarda TaxID=252184 RepID=A0AA39X6U7_9PEZI|nr:hypothetical protein B0T17DRAFT_614285 [Bombardia bombarda]
MWHVAGIEVKPRNYDIIVLTFLFLTFAFIVVCLRLYARAFVIRNLGIDDYLIITATITAIYLQYAVMEQIRFDFGFGLEKISERPFTKTTHQYLVTHVVAMAEIKLSFLFQYRRIFQSPPAKRIINIILIWFIVYGAFAIFSCIFTCWPVARYWDESITGPGGCLDRVILQWVLNVVNIINDFILFFLPMPFLKSLHVKPRVRAALIAVFAAGGLVCIISIIRLRYLAFIDPGIKPGDVTSVDQSGYFNNASLWSCLEIYIGIICACVAGIKPLFSKLLSGPDALSGETSRTLRTGTGFGRTGTRGQMSRHISAAISNDSVPLRSFIRDLDDSHNQKYPHSDDVELQSVPAGNDRHRFEILIERTVDVRSVKGDDDGSVKDLGVRVACEGETHLSRRSSIDVTPNMIHTHGKLLPG